MECLLCIAAIYLSGSMGVQNQPPTPVFPTARPLGEYSLEPTNDYGRLIGSAAITVELENGLFIRGTHLSGASTAEWDRGLNALEVGAHVYLMRKK